jgi:hypothetical protein
MRRLWKCWGSGGSLREAVSGAGEIGREGLGALVRLLGLIFLPRTTPPVAPPSSDVSRVLRSLKRLGRRRRREGMVSCDLGSLGKTLYREVARERAIGSGHPDGGTSPPPREVPGGRPPGPWGDVPGPPEL